MLDSDGKLINPEVRIETCNFCQARCIMCAYTEMTRWKGVMSTVFFKDLIKQAKDLGTKLISPFGFGEPLLDFQLANRIKMCTDLGFDTFITTNGAWCDRDTTLKLFKAGLKHLRISIHALNAENYERVQPPLNWNTLIDNIASIMKLKTAFPDTMVSITVIPMSGETVEEIKIFWKKFGIDKIEIWRAHNWSAVKDYREKTKKRLKTCGRLARGPLQIEWDGNIIPCFLPGQKVITENLMPCAIEDIAQKVKIWNGDGDIDEVVIPTKNYYDGIIYKIKPHYFPEIFVTANHEFMIDAEKESKPARELVKNDRLLIPKLSLKHDKKILELYNLLKNRYRKLKCLNNQVIYWDTANGHQLPWLLEKQKLTYGFGFLSGAWLAEGSIIGANKLQGITFHLGLHERKFAEKIKKLFRDHFGLDLHEEQNSKNNNLTLRKNHKLLACLFKELFGVHCHEKRIHPILLSSNENFIKGLLDGFIAGDGHRGKTRDRSSFTTTSINLAYQLFFLFIDATKIIPCFYHGKGKPNKYAQTRLDFYTISFSENGNQPGWVLDLGNYYSIKIHRITEEKHEGMVHCLQLKKEPWFLVEGVAVHNCCFLTNDELVLGNAHNKSLKEILLDKPYKKLRRQHETGNLKGLPCENCDQLNVEREPTLLYSSIDPDCVINRTSSMKFNLI